MTWGRAVPTRERSGWLMSFALAGVLLGLVVGIPAAGLASPLSLDKMSSPMSSVAARESRLALGWPRGGNLLEAEVTASGTEPAAFVGDQIGEAEDNGSAGDPSVEPKSTKRAFFYSLLLPGLGERYVGARNRSLMFMGVEALLWVGFASYQIQGELRRQDYEEHARIYAGVSTGGKTDDFYRDINFYKSSEVYNEAVRWDARALYPNDLETQRRYYDQHKRVGDLAWEWESDPSWDQYRRIRRASKRSFRTGVYITGAILANHLISAVHAAKLAHDTTVSHESDKRSGFGRAQRSTTLEVFPTLDPAGGEAFSVVLRHRF